MIKMKEKQALLKKKKKKKSEQIEQKQNATDNALWEITML